MLCSHKHGREIYFYISELFAATEPNIGDIKMTHGLHNFSFKEQLVKKIL